LEADLLVKQGEVAVSEVVNKFNKRYSVEEKLGVIRAVEGGRSIREVTKELGVSPETYRNWKVRYLREGEPGLENRDAKGRRPDEQDPATPSLAVGESVVDPKTLGLILTEKARHPLVGIRSFAAQLKNHHQVEVSPSTLARIFERHGIARVSNGNGKPYEALEAFEHPYAMDMWQIDWHRFRIAGRGPFYVFGATDDRSRYNTALTLCQERTAEVAIASLKSAFSELGPPSQLLSDNGPEFVGKWGSKAESKFTSFLRGEDVVHVRASSHRPTTLGKQERFWQTLERELLLVTWFKDENDARERLAAWREYYNTSRPSLALDGKVPAEVFFNLRRPTAEPKAAPVETAKNFTLEAVVNGRTLKIVAQGGLSATLDGVPLAS
jgi:transposase InsO family protein